LKSNWRPTYHDKTGAPGIDTRLMVALHYLKYQHDLSDEVVVASWVENPYWQHFSGRSILSMSSRLIRRA
jgi:IS5 family transposase